MISFAKFMIGRIMARRPVRGKVAACQMTTSSRQITIGRSPHGHAATGIRIGSVAV